MIIKVKVKPASGRQNIEKISDSEYKVFLKSRAEDNKANIELLKLLKKHFSGQDIKILKGLKSKDKIIEAE
jgi:uncharacterized protein (TIGR00251 family)